MNVERLKALRDAILAHPENYNQQSFFSEITDGDYPETTQVPTTCGTAACIAGKAILMFHPEGRAFEKAWLKDIGIHDRFDSPLNAGAKLLELTDEEADRLFSEINFYSGSSEEFYHEMNSDTGNHDYWPYEFAKRYYNAETAEGRAKAAADRIDYFIETGK